MLYNNDYSTKTAESWEKNVFERNIKSFNKALDNDYHVDLDDGLEYNKQLMLNVKAVIAKYAAQGTPLAGLKADYLAERSIPDNIELETS